MPSDRDTPDRLPPYSRDAERSVLGSLLRDNRVIGDVVQIIFAEHFYLDAHQKIYQAVTTLYNDGKPVDLVLLADYLKQANQIEDVGGYAYLAELWDAAPTAANAEYYARIVRDKALVRGLIHASTEILRDAYDQAQPAEELLGAAEHKIFEIAQMGVTGQTFTLEKVLDEAYDRIDTRYQRGAGTVSGLGTGFLDLDDKTAGLQNSELVIIAARPSCGKCLAFDSEIVLADGSVATLEDLYRRRQARLMTLRDDWRFEQTEPSAFVDDGVKPVYRVTTRLGRRVETTLSHPFRTLHGWQRLSELEPGDPIAVPREISIFGTETLRECQIKLLAYLLGDGCLTQGSPRFTNSNPRIQGDFTSALEEFAALKVREETSGGTRTLSLHVAGEPIQRASRRREFAARMRKAFETRKLTGRAVAGALRVSPALVCIWQQGTCVPNVEAFEKLCEFLDMAAEDLAPGGIAALTSTGKNLLTTWLRELGVWGKDAHGKFIPDVVFRLTRPLLALFLNRLFSTDGWATAHAQGQLEIGYASVSERLARQIQHLLLRFGINATLRRRAVKYRDTRRIAWQLTIRDQQGIRDFLDRIGIFGKEAAMARLERRMEGRTGRPGGDQLPMAVWDELARAKGDNSWCAVARRAGMGGHTNIHVQRRALSRPRLLKFARAVGDPALQELACSEVYWDEIVSIEPVGEKQVYDLTIPETHNFVANDICVHNTAFALNIARHIVIEENQPAFFVSLEQSRVELAERLLCCQARVDSHKLRQGRLSADDMDKLIEAGGVLKNGRLFIDDTPGQGMLRIAANARRLKLRHNIRIVLVDYLQLIEPDNRRDPRQEQVANISRRLKFLARELEIPVVALAQVNRSSEERQDHRPRLGDLRESGSLEQDADTVFLLHRPEMYEPGQHEGTIEVIIGKQRNGPTGEVTLTFIKQFMRFENFAIGGPFEG